jgi:hypothetical protein
MPVTLSVTYPVAGETVAFTSTTGDSDVCEYSLVTAPADSALTAGKLVNAQGVAVREFVPDVPGAFVLALFPKQEMCADAATGIYLKTLVTESFTVHVGAALYLDLAPTNGHRSRLKLTIVGSTVRAAELVEPATTLARDAALDTTVAAAVEALVDVTVAGLDNTLETNANALRSAWGGHRVAYSPSGPSVHNSVDTVNTTISGDARSNEAAIILVRHLAQRITTHMMPGILDQGWHDFEDSKNTLMVSPNCTTLAQATVLSADLRFRVFRRHIGQVSDPQSHNTADPLNDVPNAQPLSAAIVAFLDYVSSNNPTAPGNESEGVADALGRFGLAA